MRVTKCPKLNHNVRLWAGLRLLFARCLVCKVRRVSGRTPYGCMCSGCAKECNGVIIIGPVRVVRRMQES